MSNRTIASSSPKSVSASARASSVLPTPVGPRNRNEPTGRFGSPSPARARRPARAPAPEAARRCGPPGPGRPPPPRARARLDGLVLPDDALVDLRLEAEQPLALLLG